MGVEEDLKTCEDELNALQESLDEARSGKAAAGAIKTAGAGNGDDSDIKLGIKRKLASDAKVSDLTWWPSDNEHICTVLQDGKIIIWNSKTAQKAYFICQNTWLMTGDFSYDGNHLAVAGLDNLVTIHKVPALDKPGEFEPAPDQSAQKIKQMEKHGGYIGSVKWLDDSTVISGSGDKSIMLWDVSLEMGVQKDPKELFTGHGLTVNDMGDVAALDTFKGETNTFISGASDGYAKLWDRRLPTEGNRCAMTFSGHTDNINKIKYLPNGKAFVTASEDGNCNMFDLRCNAVVQTYNGDKGKATAVALSASGRYLFTGYNSGEMCAWDVLNPDAPKQTLEHHSSAVTSIELAADGKAIGSCSRETSNNFAIWA